VCVKQQGTINKGREKPSSIITLIAITLHKITFFILKFDNHQSLIMNCKYGLKITSIEEPTFTIPKDDPFSNHFYINFYYCQVSFPLHLNTSNSSSACETTMNRIFFIPCDILCNCDEITPFDKDANTFLYYTFSSMPVSSDILKQILPEIGKYAKKMVANNDEGHAWEINVMLCVYTWYIEDDDALRAVFLVDKLKKVGMDHSSCYSTDQCSICLKELFSGSKSECVITKCLHVFHRECIFQWLKSCFSHESSLCPLCRNNDIF
jgi:hypothetical protein